MYFRYFVIISSWKKTGSFIWTILNPFRPRMFCAKFGWNLPSGSGEEDENVKSLDTDGQTDRDKQTDDRWSEKLTWAFCSGELKKIEFPSPKDATGMCQALLKLARWFWRRRFLNLLFPWKRAWPCIWTNLYPLHPRMLGDRFDWN